MLLENKIDKTKESEYLCSPCIIQGGVVNYTLNVSDTDAHYDQDTPSQYSIPTSNRYFAVDVHTWGLSVLSEDIADIHNLTTPFELWRQVRKLGGYNYKYTTDSENCDETVYGVGYTYPNVNATNGGIVSGEWTLGAIFAVRTLHSMYGNSTRCTSNSNFNYEYAIYDADTKKRLCKKEFVDASKFCSFAKLQLENDEKNMMNTVSNELKTNIVDMSANGMQYGHQIGMQTDAIYYANQVHYNIPFGWYAEMNPSMASTAWMVFAENGVNPMRVDMTTGQSPIS